MVLRENEHVGFKFQSDCAFNRVQLDFILEVTLDVSGGHARLHFAKVLEVKIRQHLYSVELIFSVLELVKFVFEL